MLKEGIFPWTNKLMISERTYTHYKYWKERHLDPIIATKDVEESRKTEYEHATKKRLNFERKSTNKFNSVLDNSFQKWIYFIKDSTIH